MLVVYAMYPKFFKKFKLSSSKMEYFLIRSYNARRDSPIRISQLISVKKSNKKIDVLK